MTNAVVKQAESILVVEIGLLLQGEIIFIVVLTTPRAEELLHIDGNTAAIVVVCKYVCIIMFVIPSIIISIVVIAIAIIIVSSFTVIESSATN